MSLSCHGQGVVGVLVVIAGVEQFGALGAQRDVQPVLDGMQDDEVAQDVPLDGQQKGRPGTFQALEQVGAAEAHQARAGAGQARDQSALLGGGRVLRRGYQVVAETVPRQDQ